MKSMTRNQKWAINNSPVRQVLSIPDGTSVCMEQYDVTNNKDALNYLRRNRVMGVMGYDGELLGKYAVDVYGGRSKGIILTQKVLDEMDADNLTAFELKKRESKKKPTPPKTKNFPSKK